LCLGINQIFKLFLSYRLAPEYPHPIPINDCYSATKYILQNPREFNADPSRIVIAGDSAGGNATAVVTQRILAEKLPQPKLQVLIYPWLQMINFNLPAMNKYGGGAISVEKLILWYLGLVNAKSTVLREFREHNHTALIPDAGLRQRIKSYLDVTRIPDKYKTGKKYYKHYHSIEKKIYQESLHEKSVLHKEKHSHVRSLAHKFYDPTVSPLFADHESLVGLPRALIVSVENDPIKDEGLLYAERLKKARVDVDVMFYDNGAYHGIVTQIEHKGGYQIARDMQDDLINYLSGNL
jgi:acetyl esterase/lipase